MKNSICLLQCVAVCCIVLQCGAVCCIVLPCVVVCCSQHKTAPLWQVYAYKYIDHCAFVSLFLCIYVYTYIYVCLHVTCMYIYMHIYICTYAYALWYLLDGSLISISIRLHIRAVWRMLWHIRAVWYTFVLYDTHSCCMTHAMTREPPKHVQIALSSAEVRPTGTKNPWSPASTNH